MLCKHFKLRLCKLVVSTQSSDSVEVLALHVSVIVEWGMKSYTQNWNIWVGWQTYHLHHSVKRLVWPVVAFKGNNYTDCLTTIKNNFMFSSIITTNFQKALKTRRFGPNTHKSSANRFWFTNIFPTDTPCPSCVHLYELSEYMLARPHQNGSQPLWGSRPQVENQCHRGIQKCWE